MGVTLERTKWDIEQFRPMSYCSSACAATTKFNSGESPCCCMSRLVASKAARRAITSSCSPADSVGSEKVNDRDRIFLADHC